MSNINRAYRAVIYALYVKFYRAGEVFTHAMENNIKEVEDAAEMQRRASVLKSNEAKTSLFSRIFKI